ncbi:hypothetical protein KM043_000188 [Ampulex compressa]|nr:hypothetical protein KM043_000188 [Ampulex compressa]
MSSIGARSPVCSFEVTYPWSTEEFETFRLALGSVGKRRGHARCRFRWQRGGEGVQPVARLANREEQRAKGIAYPMYRFSLVGRGTSSVKAISAKTRRIGGRKKFRVGGKFFPCVRHAGETRIARCPPPLRYAKPLCETRMDRARGATLPTFLSKIRSSPKDGSASAHHSEQPGTDDSTRLADSREASGRRNDEEGVAFDAVTRGRVERACPPVLIALVPGSRSSDYPRRIEEPERAKGAEERGGGTEGMERRDPRYGGARDVLENREKDGTRGGAMRTADLRVGANPKERLTARSPWKVPGKYKTGEDNGRYRRASGGGGRLRQQEGYSTSRDNRYCASFGYLREE